MNLKRFAYVLAIVTTSPRLYEDGEVEAVVEEGCGAISFLHTIINIDDSVREQHYTPHAPLTDEELALTLGERWSDTLPEGAIEDEDILNDYVFAMD